MSSLETTSKRQRSAEANGAAGRSAKMQKNFNGEDSSKESVSSDEGDERDTSESSSDVEIVTTQTKPRFTLPATGSSALQARIRNFLPQLAQSNEALSSAKSMEDVDDDEEHIVMDLGLGVLEEKSTGSDTDSSDDESEDSEDVMSTLKGANSKQKPGIEEVG